jgi:hypothetical protein
MNSKVLETVYGLGGYDATKPNNNVVSQTTAELQADGSWTVTDENGTRPVTFEELAFINGTVAV